MMKTIQKNIRKGSSNQFQLINKGVEKISNLFTVNCDILNSGKIYHKMKFYYCDCDPFQKNSICEECRNNCHKGHITKGPFVYNKYCDCGPKGHKLLEESKEILCYDEKCFFYELLYKSKVFFCFRNMEKDIDFCAFCYTFCADHVGSQNARKIQFDNEISINKCECTSSNHKDIKLIYEKLNSKECKEFNDISLLKSYQRLINLLFICPKTFTNFYKSLDDRMLKIHKEIEANTFNFQENFEFSYDNRGLTNFAYFLSNARFIYYFSDSIKKYFAPNIIIKLLKFKNEKDTFSTVEFKENCLIGMFKCIIKVKFMKFPKVSFDDLENLTPFQRLLLTKETKNQNLIKFFDSKDKSLNEFYIIDETLDFISKLISLSSVIIMNLNLMPTLIMCIKYLSLFILYNLFDLKQKILFCKLIEMLLSKHVIKNIKGYKMNAVKLFMKILQIVLAFNFQANDEVFFKAMILDQKIEPNEFFQGKNEISKETSKINILIGGAIHSIENMYSKQKKKLTLLNNKIVSTFLSYPDCYFTGLERAASHNIDLLISLIKEGEIFSENKHIVTFLDIESEKLCFLYREYFNFECKLDNLYEAIENSIKNFFVFIKLDEYYLSKPSLSIMEGKIGKGCYDEIKKEFPETNIFQKRTTSSNHVYKIEVINHILLKSNYLYIVFDLLKINLNQIGEIDNHSMIPPKIMEMITKLLFFFTEGSPDNCLILLNKNFIKFFIPYINKHFTQVFSLYYQAFKQVINRNNEFTNHHHMLKIIKHFLNCIKNDSSKILFLSKILKLYGRIVNEFTSFNEKLVSIVRRKIFKIYNDFESIRIYIPKLLENIEKGSSLNQKVNGNSNIIIKHLNINYNQTVNLRTNDKINNDKNFTHYLKLFNDVFDTKLDVMYKNFIYNLIKIDSIPIILKNYQINLSLRSEILRYFRMLYIDILIIPEKI